MSKKEKINRENSAKTKTLKDYIEILKVSLKTIKISFKAESKITSLYLLSDFFNGLIPVIKIWLGKLIIDELVIIITETNAGSLNNIFLYIALLFLSDLISNLLRTIHFFSTTRIWDELSRYAHLSIIKQNLNLDMSYFEDPEYYNEYEKVRQRIDSTLPRTLFAVSRLTRSLVTFTSIIVVLVSINWLLFPVIVLINIPVLVWGMGYSLTRYDLANSHVPEGRKAAYLADLTTNKYTIKEVKLFDLGNYFTKRYQKYFDRVVKENWNIAKKQFSGAFGTSLVGDIAYYGFYIWIVLRAVAGAITIGDVSLFISSFSRASGTLSGMLRDINQLYSDGFYINDFEELLSLKSKIKSPKNAKKLKEVKNIKFENVSFRYKPDKSLVLKNISFEIKEDENTALVGVNGAGKTTIVKLLLRFYDPTEGAIYINGVNIKKYDLQSLWKQFATIFQNFEKYQLTVKENIGFGQIDKINKLDEIKESAKKANADVFIKNLSEKYNTLLGTRFEGGTDLSLGQWQRVALARAFIRDSSVVILDEPTASLDAKAEYEIFKKFIELVEGQITILISHRFSTVRIADNILVIEDGQLTEKGSHKKLLNKKGKYAEMFNLQAEGYK